MPHGRVVFRQLGKQLAEERPHDAGKETNSPGRSPTFINPRNKFMTPINPSEISTLVFAVAKMPSTMFLNISVFPKNTNLMIAATNASRKKDIR